MINSINAAESMHKVCTSFLVPFIGVMFMRLDIFCVSDSIFLPFIFKKLSFCSSLHFWYFA